MDGYDRQLLAALQADADQTAEQLTARVALSPSAIQRRIRRLKETGAIERTVAIASPRALGSPTFLVVSLEVERERPELMAHFRRWLSAEDQIQQAYYVTGNADFVLIVTATDMERYEALMSRMLAENPNVRRYHTNVMLGHVKRGLTIPVPDS